MSAAVKAFAVLGAKQLFQIFECHLGPLGSEPAEIAAESCGAKPTHKVAIIGMGGLGNTVLKL